MGKFIFNESFMQGEDQIATLESIEEGFPLNVCMEEGSSFDLKEGDECELVNLSGVAGNMSFFDSSEEYYETKPRLADCAMIPCGTFPANEEDDEFEPSPTIIFTGKVLDTAIDPEAGDWPNCMAEVETYGFTISLYWHDDEKKLPKVGGIMKGQAWIYADVVRCAKDSI